MNNLLNDNARALIEYKARKKVLKDEEKVINEQIDLLQKEMVDQMEADGTEMFAVDGTTFYIKSTLYAHLPAEKRETFIRRLRARKLGAIVRPTINASTLTSFAKEQAELNGGNLPIWMDDLVSTYYKTEIGTRKRG